MEMAFALILSPAGKKSLSVRTEISTNRKSFEQLNQFSGLVVYETDLPYLKIDPSLLTVNELRDRALIYVDGYFVGVLSRENSIKSLPISSGFGKRLQIVVENQGRINFVVANDTKGIFGPITVQQTDGKMIELNDNWESISMPLEIKEIQKLIEEQKREHIDIKIHRNGLLLEGPIVFVGEFTISSAAILDTYLNPSDWGKGVVYINGFNLGRYWPLVGPQKTIYVPKELLKSGINQIIMIEYQKSSIDSVINFTSHPQLDG